VSNHNLPLDVVGVNRWLKRLAECRKGEDGMTVNQKYYFLVAYSLIFSLSELSEGSPHVIFKYGTLNS